MPLYLHDRLLKYRRTKIVATLGPSSSNEKVIKELIAAGANVFRLNMSHGNREAHTQTYQTIRQIAKELGASVAILVDLSGPKMRTGKFLDGKIQLVQNEQVIVTVENVMGKPGLIPSQYKGLAKDVVPGNRILLNDGALELQVESIADKEIHCKIIHGGVLKDHKGINLPGVNVSVSALTEKDKLDAILACHLGADYLALSFVQRASDIEELRTLIKANNGKAEIIAKIEKPEALENIDQILDTCDGVMIARGDLGVEMPPEDVPNVQDQLIVLARLKMKPVIVATQMLESMISNPKPTRAEVTDVSNAVNCGSDAVMLSAETASGQYPVQSVQMMDRIIRRAEARLWKKGVWGSSLNLEEKKEFENVISSATAKMSRDLMSHAVMVTSTFKKSALIIGSARPASPVVAIVDNDSDFQRMALLWGIIPILHTEKKSNDLVQFAREISKKLGLAAPGDCILLVDGFNSDPNLNTPSITIITI